MNEEQDDFAAKLTLVEREAKLVLEDLPPGVMRNRVQHIATIVALLRQRLEVASSVILPAPTRKNG